jgi:urease accessory protein
MPWHASLQLDYSLEKGRTVARHQHVGPLRILQSLYPEGDAVCHNVLVHPPGGLVGGDTLELAIHAAAGSHGLLTTPGATRFYRAEDAPARQITQLRLDEGARLEWLPQETLYYSGCRAENNLRMEIAPGAELMGWDITALGLPHAGLPFETGYVQQQLQWPGVWRERARVAADDALLMQGRAGLAGMRCTATLYLACGTPLGRAAKETALDAARALIADHRLSATAGATSPNPQTVLVRVLSDQVEPTVQLLRAIRMAWRQAHWQLSAAAPRIWAM